LESLLSFKEPNACHATVPWRVTWTRETRVGRVCGRAVRVVVGSSSRPVVLIHDAPSMHAIAVLARPASAYGPHSSADERSAASAGREAARGGGHIRGSGGASGGVRARLHTAAVRRLALVDEADRVCSERRRGGGDGAGGGRGGADSLNRNGHFARTLCMWPSSPPTIGASSCEAR
jgi:hypothetical protein